MSHRVKRTAGWSAVLLACALFAIRLAPIAARQTQAGQSRTVAGATGATTTRLADGRWLVVGGEGAETKAWLWDPQSQAAVPTAGPPQLSRAWHTATLLPDGTVMLIGGRNGNALVEVPEIFDPSTGAFTPTSIAGTMPRDLHTATLLTDGRILVVGGTRGGPDAIPTEIWDVAAQSATAIPGDGVPRRGHTATLMSDGRVLITGGRGVDGAPAGGVLAIDSATGNATSAQETPTRGTPSLTASSPEAGATDVAVDTRLSLRFSSAMALSSLTGDTIMLTGPNGSLAVRIVPAEDGRLVFLWPSERLAEDTTYTVVVSGAVDPFGTPAAPASFVFSTAGDSSSAASGTSDSAVWLPDPAGGPNAWRVNGPDSPWRKLPPLQAPPGVTALAGQVLRLDGEPLASVKLEVEKHLTLTDRTGRFVVRLDGMTSTRSELWVDGRPASRPGATYGTYEIGVPIQGGQTTALAYTIWMPALDTAHAIPIASPTTSETIVRTPTLPGLELRLPPNTTITDHDGKRVTELTITPVPINRPPFPLPAGVEVPIYFTVQPGGAYLRVAGAPGRGGRLIYPNGLHLPIGMAMDFWRYEPDGVGWTVYGQGRVTPDGQHVVPNPGVEFYEFTGAMVGGPGLAPSSDPPKNGKKDGDPVDLYSGLFVLQKTDLALPDVVPIALTRTYRQADSRSRAFGIGASHPYDVFLVGDTANYSYFDLVFEDGGRIHFDRTDGGTGWTPNTLEFTQLGTPTDWYKARTVWNGTGWTMTKKDGTVLKFQDGFSATRPQQAALAGMTDRFGNVVTLTRDGNANLTEIRAPNGRFIRLTYDGNFRITEAKDNIGRTVGYEYDGSGRLWKVTDPENGVTKYTYDSLHRMMTLEDPRGIVYLMNQYDGNDRVSKQVLPDGGTYLYAYSVNGQGQKVTEVTNPRGYITRTTFNSAGYELSTVQAVGTSVERTTTTERYAATNLVQATVESLLINGISRRTEYTYYDTGRVHTVKRAVGTSDEATTTFEYESTYQQLSNVIDPLQHAWTITYDGSGRMTGTTDPLGHHTTIALNAAGQVTSVTDPLSHQWQVGYTDSDLTSTTNPLNQTATRFVDGAGRLVWTTDPLGRMTKRTVDKLNRVTTVTDPISGVTGLSYDPNSNLQSLTDALLHMTSYTYDLNDRVATRTDPVQAPTTSGYDLAGNLTQIADRKGQVTQSQYDALDRLSQVTHADGSTVAYTYDLGNRVTQIDDSSVGAPMTRTYDGLDRLLSETTPEGSISYTYDTASRRATMTVGGQPQVTYDYDDANRLTSITQGLSGVGFTYDDANRRSTLTFPNGIVATYGYDPANQLTSLIYSFGQTSLGDLTYTYDATGRRTSVGGTRARTGIPAVLASATYDVANRIVSWDGRSFSYDANGNLASDGLTSYSWNARNQLVALSGGTAASFAYDAFGRRREKAIGGMTTDFLYDKLNLVQELANGTPSANLLNGSLIDEILTRSDTNGSMTLLTDAQRSTIALTDTSGAVQTSYTFEPFGQTVASGSPSASAAQFTSRENDGAALYYYRSRFYSPPLQRFVSEDPKGFAGGDVNLFSYVSNSPITFVDPLGLDRTIWDFGGNGRNPLDGPRNGNWGGDNWSGGRVPSQNGRDGTLPPTDSADRCYMEHDKCYERCSDRRLCDLQILKCLERLSWWDPRRWPEPPRPGTETDSLLFLLGAHYVFGQRVFGDLSPW